MTDLDIALDELLSNDKFSRALDSGDLFTVLNMLFDNKNSGIVEHFIKVIVNEDKTYFHRYLLNDLTRLSPSDIDNSSRRYSGLDINNKRFSDNLRLLHALRSVIIPETKTKAEVISGMRDKDCYIYLYCTANIQTSKLELSDTYLSIPFIYGGLTYRYTIPTEPCYSKVAWQIFQNLSKEEQMEITGNLCASINAFYDFALDTVKSYIERISEDK